VVHALIVLSEMKLVEARSKDGETILRFEWSMDEWGSIHDHRIIARSPYLNEEFRFGECARFGLRKVHRFFGDASIADCGLGFRNPQIITYDLNRNSTGSISLTVEDANRREPISVDLGCDIETREWKEDQPNRTEQNGAGRHPSL
jgi:hypothetical protein